MENEKKEIHYKRKRSRKNIRLIAIVVLLAAICILYLML